MTRLAWWDCDSSTHFSFCSIIWFLCVFACEKHMGTLFVLLKIHFYMHQYSRSSYNRTIRCCKQNTDPHSHAEQITGNIALWGQMVLPNPYSGPLQVLSLEKRKCFKKTAMVLFNFSLLDAIEIPKISNRDGNKKCPRFEHNADRGRCDSAVVMSCYFLSLLSKSVTCLLICYGFQS